MNKLTNALLKAQFLLKDQANLTDILATLVHFSEQKSEGILSPDVEEAIATIDKIYQRTIS